MRITCLRERSEELEKRIEEVYPSFKWAVYKYETESYSGGGNLILKTASNKYFYADLSHCSCCGPEEYIKDNEKNIYDTLKEAFGKGSKEYFKQMDETIKVATQNDDCSKGRDEIIYA